MVPFVITTFQFAFPFERREDVINQEASTPDPSIISQTQSLPETLKEGDEIVVVNVPNGLRMWGTYFRSGKSIGSVKNGDVGEILATKIHDNYIIHYVEWCNGEMNWVAEKDPDGDVYLKKR